MTEEPEDVLEQHGVATARRVEERRAEEFVGQQHGDRAGQHRHRGDQQECRDDPGPYKQRQLHQRHARRTQIEDGCDDIDRARNR